MSCREALNFIHREVYISTGLDTDIICDEPLVFRFITDKRSSRSIDMTKVTSMTDLIFYARQVSLMLAA